MDHEQATSSSHDQGTGSSSSLESDASYLPLRKRQKYYCSYQSSWEKEEGFKGWVKKSTKGNSYAFCTFCGKDIKICCGGANDLLRHSATALHQGSAKTVNTTPNIATFMAANTSLATKVIKSEVLFSSFVAEHNLAINVAEHAGKLFKAMFPDSEIAKRFSCGRTKTTEVIKGALAPFYTKPVITAMCRGPFSILMDETTDNTTEKEAVLLCVFFDDKLGRVVCRFYGLPVCNIATGQTLFKLIEDAFAKDGIPWNNLVGFGSDGASVMLGSRNSVLSRLRSVQPHLWHTHCICHVAHLCAAHAAKKLPADIENVVIDVYYHFHRSSKRVEQFKNFQEFCEVEPLTILKHVSTRWLSLHTCISRILQQWDALCSYFNSHEQLERDAKIIKIAELLQSHLFKLYYSFLAAVIPSFNKFNLLFQEESPVLYRLYNEQDDLLKGFLAKYIKATAIAAMEEANDVNYENVENQLSDEDVFIGSQTRIYLVQHEDDLIASSQFQEFFTNVRQYYCEATRQIKKRFSFGDTVLKHLIVLDPEKRLSVTTSNIAGLAVRFPNIIRGEDVDKLIDEFLEYQHMNLDAALLDKEKTPVDVFWHIVSCQLRGNKKRFEHLPKLMKAMLCLPHSNAAAERVFSMVKAIKTDARNRLHNTTLSSLVACKVNTDSKCYDHEPPVELLRLAKSASYIQISEY